MASQVDKEVKYKSSNACDVKCLKAVVIAFNFLFIVAGSGLFAIGIWTVITKMEYVSILGSAYYNLIVALLILTGFMVLVTGILGCIGAVKLNSKLLLWYSILLALIFLFELIAGILAFAYRGFIHDELSSTMMDNLNTHYNQSGQEVLTDAADLMQQTFHCCGVLAYSDWFNSTFVMENKNGLGLKTPTSCCKTPSFDCSKSDHPSNIYRVLGADSMGCLIQLEIYVQEHLFIIAIIGITVACFELIVLLMACGLRRAIVIENNKPY